MASNQVSLSAHENLVLYSISNGKAGGVSTHKTFKEYVHLKPCQYFIVNSLYSQYIKEIDQKGITQYKRVT